MKFYCRALIFAAALLVSQPEAKAVFTELLYNSKWYRTYDSTSFIKIEDGQLLFAWAFGDSDKIADSFYVGIDTLWALPQDVSADTGNDWDLQVCPNEFCIQGLKAGIYGGDAFFPFGDTVFSAEHHIQFYPALGPDFRALAPVNSLFAGLLFVRSRSSGAADTVLCYGGWKLTWDEISLPPLRPVNGYLPRKSDFIVSGDTVRYAGPSGIEASPPPSENQWLQVSPSPFNSDLTIRATEGVREIRVFDLRGRLVFHHRGGSRVVWDSRMASSGIYLIEGLAPEGRSITKTFKLR